MAKLSQYNYEHYPDDELRSRPKKLTDWKQEPDLRELKRDLELARPVQREHVEKVERWLDNLRMQGSAKIKAEKGRSSVQPKLIRKQAEWRYSSLSEPFLAAEKIFSVVPTSWEDLAAADQNETLLNWQFRTKIDLVKFIDEFVHTIVDEGTVIVRTGWNRKERTIEVDAPVYEYFPIHSEEQGQAIQEAMQLRSSNPLAYSDLPPDVKESVEYSIQTEQMLIAVQTGTEKVDQIEVLANHPTLEVVELGNIVFDATCNGDLDKAMFMAYTYEVTRGDLEQDDRYQNLKHVEWGKSPLSEPDLYTQSPAEITFQAQSRQKVVMTEYYGLYDIEGDGHLTPILMCWIGDVVVRIEENPFPDGKPPFVVVPYMPIKKSPYGEPDGELLEDNQRILGAVTRGIIDTLARSANGQRGMAKGMLDVTNRRRYERGQDYDFNPNMHPKNAVVEHTFPEIPASAFNMVSMQSQDAESLTGVKMYDDGLNSGSLGKVAAGIRGALDAANRREMAILRRLSNGLVKIGAKIIAMNQQFLTEEEVVRVTNKEFVTIRREDIQGQFDLAVEVSTPGEDDAKASRLEFMLQTLGNNSSPEMVNLILSQIAKLRKMPTLAHQIENYEPEPDLMAMRMAELQIAEMEAKVQKAEAEAYAAMAKAQLDQSKAREVGSKADLADLDYVEQETGTKHAREIEKVGEQARANQQLEITKGAMKMAADREAARFGNRSP